MSNIKNITCPCCGGSLKFNLDTQNVQCEFCGTEFQTEDLKNLDDSLKEEFKENTEWDVNSTDEFTSDEASQLGVFHCETCGGEIMCDINTSSTRCPYCNNPVILSSRLSGGLKPTYIIPFKYEKDYALNCLSNFLKKKVLLPNDFKKENKVEDISGLYVPYWIFDADVSGKATWRGTRTRTWSDSNYRYHETRHYKIIREGNISFEHIPVDASTKMPDALMESIEPFDFKGAKSFSVAYISGYCSDRYDVSKEENFKRANVRINEGTVDALRGTVGYYTTLALESANIRLNNNSASYAYYPVWTLNTRYHDKDFKFAMNGQTGKFIGNLPMSKIKFALWLIIPFLLVGALLFGLFFVNLKDSSNRVPVSVGVGLVAGLIAGLSISLSLKRQLKPVRMQHGARNYVVPGSFGLTSSWDLYLYKTVTRTRINTNNRR